MPPQAFLEHLVMCRSAERACGHGEGRSVGVQAGGGGVAVAEAAGGPAAGRRPPRRSSCRVGVGRQEGRPGRSVRRGPALAGLPPALLPAKGASPDSNLVRHSWGSPVGQGQTFTREGRRARPEKLRRPGTVGAAGLMCERPRQMPLTARGECSVSRHRRTNIRKSLAVSPFWGCCLPRCTPTRGATGKVLLLDAGAPSKATSSAGAINTSCKASAK